MHTPALTLLRIGPVLARYGGARPTLYEHMAEGLFPRPVKLGPKFVAWPEHEVSAIIAARIAGKPLEAIRALVVELTAARQRISVEVAGQFEALPPPVDCDRLRV